MDKIELSGFEKHVIAEAFAFLLEERLRVPEPEPKPEGATPTERFSNAMIEKINHPDQVEWRRRIAEGRPPESVLEWLIRKKGLPEEVGHGQKD